MLELLYQAHGGSGLNLSLTDILRLDMSTMYDIYTWLGDRRSAEAQSIRDAYKK